MRFLHWNELLIPYEQAVDELRVKFSALEREYRRRGQHSPIESVAGRVKSISSILEKADRKGIPLDQIEQKIEDIAGIRLICRFVDDIEKVVLLIRERSGKDMEIVEERNYVAKMKPSGYRSYHIHIRYPVMMTTEVRRILVEIQIRTMSMDFWATIEHSLKYKYNGNMPENLQERLIATATAAFQLDREMGTIRGEILEVQRIMERKNDIVARIVTNIENLYFVAHLEKMDELNKQFYDLFHEGNIEHLSAFNEQLRVMAQVYKLEYV